MCALSAQNTASLKGTVTDPSGSVVPGALVQLHGPGGELRAKTNETGAYSFLNLRPGNYRVRVIATGFTVSDRQNFPINAPTTLDVQLTIETEATVVNVEEEADRVNVDPSSNSSAIVLGEKELATLSDDPDELAQQLQAMAGPAAGPNGGQIYIDGFTGGNLPPKASIREVRINSNPYAPEYDRPGFGRIEILTKPGTDFIRGQAFFQFNNENFNSRNPLLQQSSRPPYMNRFYGLHLSGPIKKQKASFGFDVERRSIDENAFIYATTLDSNLLPTTVNEAVLTPQVRTIFSPRLDYQINAMNTLVLRYQNVHSSQENNGIGDYSLSSRAYDTSNQEHVIQATETAVLSPKMINEVRFQWMRSSLDRTGDNTIPTLNVQGAFTGGGSSVGNSGNTENRFELTNMTTYTRGTHTIKWGARVRRSSLEDVNVNNFGGTYTFFGGLGPQLDANNQPIAGPLVQLDALERYRRTLLFQQLGDSADAIRLLGGGASQFTLNAGLPLAAVRQWDVGVFANDDWRVRPNLTLSYGLRYETQTNIGDKADWSPRIGIAWGIDAKGNSAAKTILRAGFGIFYDRVSETTTLNALRYNGVAQQSYLIRNPNFFPLIPDASALASSAQPQQVQVLDSDLQAPRNYQASLGLERQINKYARVSVQYVSTRGVHLLRQRNINAPINGAYPYGDPQVRLLSETTGFSRTNQLIIQPNVNYKKLFLFGFYSYAHGNSDAEGLPANPYDLRAEWGPSSYGDIRHRFVVGTSLPLVWGVSVSPFVMAQSGAPYNITTGRDTNGDGFTNDRPALLPGVLAANCVGGNFSYETGFGCFDLNPAPGTAIGRNASRGPATFNLNVRLARTWSFGGRSESSGAPDSGGPRPGGGMGGMRGGGPGGPGGMGGGMRGGGMGGGMFGASSGKKYNLMLSVSAHNILNRANYAPPSGDLSSPYFGDYRSLAGFGPFGGSSTYNRKIDLQLRFTF